MAQCRARRLAHPASLSLESSFFESSERALIVPMLRGVPVAVRYTIGHTEKFDSRKDSPVSVSVPIRGVTPRLAFAAMANCRRQRATKWGRGIGGVLSKDRDCQHRGGLKLIAHSSDVVFRRQVPAPPEPRIPSSVASRRLLLDSRPRR